MLLNFFVSLLILWETVYSVSFGIALLRSEQKAGGILVFALAALAFLLYLNYIFEVIMI